MEFSMINCWMPLDKHNSITMGLTFSLFNVISALEVPLGTPQYASFTSFVFYSSLFTANGIDLAVAHDGFLCTSKW